MTTCANCVTTALYSYVEIPYCERHLPRFLRDRYGKPNQLVAVIVPATATTTVDLTLVPDVLEPVVEPEVVVEETPKKKAAPKAE